MSWYRGAGWRVPLVEPLGQRARVVSLVMERKSGPRLSSSVSESACGDSLPLLDLWRERYRSGLIQYDPEILVLQPIARADDVYGWGTVFYSKAREDYKRRVGDATTRSQTSFDLDLMHRLAIGRHGRLVIAANPNSILQGHLVVYPEEKTEDLSFVDLEDICALAPPHPEFTFIHNMHGAAASIVDWAHYQGYPLAFPLSREPMRIAHTAGDVVLSVPDSDYPAFIVAADGPQRLVSRFLFELLGALKSGDAPGQRRIPCNIIWHKRRVWVVPRSRGQSAHAAAYIGGLEMGGLFCLPTADSLSSYLPGELRREVRRASLHDQPEDRRWFLAKASEIADDLR